MKLWAISVEILCVSNKDAVGYYDRVDFKKWNPSEIHTASPLTSYRYRPMFA